MESEGKSALDELIGKARLIIDGYDVGIDKLLGEIHKEVKESDKKRHKTNTHITATLDKYNDRIVKVEGLVDKCVLQTALHDMAIKSIQERHDKTDEVVENNTKASQAQALAFTELSTSVKVGIRILIFVVPIMSSLVAYIINLLVG